MADGQVLMVLPCVILSGAGAFATAQSKDPEDADCDEAESGNSLETLVRQLPFDAKTFWGEHPASAW